MTEATPQLPSSALPPDKGAEYAEAMLKKAEGADVPADELKPEEKKAEEAPKLLAGKFKSADELEKAYAELQKKLGEKTQAPPQEKKPVEKTAEEKAAAEKAEAERVAALTPEQKAAEEAAKKATEKAGVNFQDLSKEFAENGELSAESYEALEKGGIPREMVDQFIDGQIAAAKLARADVTNSVGGEEKFNEIISWAKDNLSAEDIAAYNKIATGKDTGAIKVALAGLKAKFDADGGSEPNLIGGDQKGGVVGYKSFDELKKDQADPKYATDPAFRAEVIRKLRASSI